MAFLVKVLFRWNECSKNADISVLSNFLALFLNFFLYIEKFYQVLSTCQISDQLEHSNRNYRGGAESALPRPYQSAKSPACFSLFFSPHFPKRKKSGLLNNLQKLAHPLLTPSQVTHLQLA